MDEPTQLAGDLRRQLPGSVPENARNDRAEGRGFGSLMATRSVLPIMGTPQLPRCCGATAGRAAGSSRLIWQRRRRRRGFGSSA